MFSSTMLLPVGDVFNLICGEDEIDLGRGEALSAALRLYRPVPEFFNPGLKGDKIRHGTFVPQLLLGFLFHEAQNIDTKASYGSPWRIHEGLTRKLPVTNKYVKPICIGFGEAEDHDLENLKKQLEDDDLIRGTITAEHQGSEGTILPVHVKTELCSHLPTPV
ncbi:hypothetical protein YC2023_020241 [Brassica napus]